MASADRVILPGVGSLGECMRNLRDRGLDEAVAGRIRAGRPYLGICLGLHILAESGDEGPEPRREGEAASKGGPVRGLGIIPGRIRRFPSDLPHPVPHMGWNEVRVARPHPLIREGYFYFVHTYRAEGVPEDAIHGITEYGETLVSAVGAETWAAVQFHPEKSQRLGLALLERFCRWSP